MEFVDQGLCLACRQRTKRHASPQDDETGQVRSSLAGRARARNADTETAGAANSTVDPMSTRSTSPMGTETPCHRAGRRYPGVQGCGAPMGTPGALPSDLHPDAPPAKQFRLPHNIAITTGWSMADRVNDRIQAFKKDGTFVKEGLSPRGPLRRAASGFANPQTAAALPMIDGANHRVGLCPRHAPGRRPLRSAGLSGELNAPILSPSTARETAYRRELTPAACSALYKGLIAELRRRCHPPARAVQ